MDWYLWVKALHIVSLISFMAGILYLPRLFVYHCEAPAGSPQSTTFSVMEKRLYRFIMGPALVLTWITGLWLAYDGNWFHAGWLHGKLLLVVALTAIHGIFGRYLRDFANGRNTRSQRFYRVINEVPTIVMIVIVILVVVKPF